jgi:intein-encoded DNA endonuclease-like protein
MAYVLGYFAADGSMHTNKRGACYIEFSTTDRELFVKVRRVMDSNHAITKKPLKVGHKQSYQLQIGSKEMYEDLTNLGFTQSKSLTLKFPKVPRSYLTDFVRGYFDGGGGISFGNYFAKDRGKERYVFMSRFTSGSRQFLVDLHEHLKLLSIKKGHIREKSRPIQPPGKSW